MWLKARKTPLHTADRGRKMNFPVRLIFRYRCPRPLGKLGIMIICSQTYVAIDSLDKYWGKPVRLDHDSKLKIGAEGIILDGELARSLVLEISILPNRPCINLSHVFPVRLSSSFLILTSLFLSRVLILFF
jgi:hypothetical protein